MCFALVFLLNMVASSGYDAMLTTNTLMYDSPRHGIVIYRRDGLVWCIDKGEWV